MIGLSVLGATGSIGRQCLDVCRWQPELRPLSMSAGQDWRALADLARIWKPEMVAIAEEAAAVPLKEALSGLPIRVEAGPEALKLAAAWPGVDTVLAAISGMAGLPPLLAAIDAKKNIALANKEALVAGGSLVMERAARAGVSIAPVDSEHSALWQCLAGERPEQVAKLILTASGGAFRDIPLEELETVRAEQALQHPNWRMGEKITIDCATMVNKGLEVIEAHWLFGVDYEDIQVLVHRESIIHSLVAFRDGSVKAQLAQADMRLPIQYALLGRERPPTEIAPPDLATLCCLHFEAPDMLRFPGLAAMIEAGRRGGTAPAYLNGANETLNLAFRRGRLGFPALGRALCRLLEEYREEPADVEKRIYEADRQGREDAARLLGADLSLFPR
ncbi:MAG: 1-deoxy-D-xylulose-5-phosphate reductoisomerase [Bacillota bacterium]|nr:1-deoxy-D-xylulose-5-phosphate reductoisomerase [Bacillota bacterium]